MNPTLPLQHFVPDGEARVMPDGRLYLYGSYDLCGRDMWCSHIQHVFSTDNLVKWVDHGICLRSEDIPWANHRRLFAPDCIYKDGQYYMYFCMPKGGEGVAVSTTPYGPFENPEPIAYANGDAIDPAVFVDDDGSAYYFWGQYHLRGAKMNADMKSLDMSTLNESIIDEKQHGFHEGACVRKRGNLYYLIYTDISRGKATCLGYAVARSPLGPYEKRGIIIDNIFCDPETWNNHGSIQEYKGQWYVFYHRSSQRTKWNRRMCIEPIEFDEKGNIKEVCMTTQGCEGPLDLTVPLRAARACQVMGGFYIGPCEDGEALFSCAAPVCNFRGTATYRYVNFKGQTRVAVQAACLDWEATIEIWADGEKLGEGTLEPVDGLQWTELEIILKPVYGIKTLYLCAEGRRVNVKELYFT